VEPKSASATSEEMVQTNNAQETDAPEDDDDDDYEYIEYDVLTEEEFVGSEWLIGTNFDSSPNRIDETWCRLVLDPNSGKPLAIWGDKSEGTWKLDVATQFLSISKENVLAGKEIWACTVDDYYYLQGTVRGWKYWSAAAVIGQWQAKRLGCSPEEAGTPPWFEENAIDSEQADNEEKKVSWKGDK